MSNWAIPTIVKITKPDWGIKTILERAQCASVTVVMLGTSEGTPEPPCLGTAVPEQHCTWIPPAQVIKKRCTHTISLLAELSPTTWVVTNNVNDYLVKLCVSMVTGGYYFPYTQKKKRCTHTISLLAELSPTTWVVTNNVNDYLVKLCVSMVTGGYYFPYTQKV